MPTETDPKVGQDTKYLLPQMGGLSVSEPAIYRSLFILDTVERYLTSGQGDRAAALTVLDKPINPFDDSKLAAEDTRKPAVGVLMVHTQSWQQSGLALGNLLQSVCLATGEVTRVAVIDWRRQESGTSAAATEQGETVSSDIEQQRAVNEVQRAVASEAQSGSSSSFARLDKRTGRHCDEYPVCQRQCVDCDDGYHRPHCAVQRGKPKPRGQFDQCRNSQRTAEKSQALRSRRQSVVRGGLAARIRANEHADSRQLQPSPYTECRIL